MNKIGYFPGCSLHSTGIDYHESLMEIAKVLDCQINEIEDWNCCGATAAHTLNKTLSVALPARNIALAEKQGFEDILVPCAACYSRLVTTKHELNEDKNLMEKIPQIIEMPIENKINNINIIDFINMFKDKLKDKVVKPFKKKVACYYGCLLVRPPKLVNVDRYEDPLMMEEIMKLIGAEPIDWAFKTECCGAGFSMSRTDIVAKLSAKILDDAIERGAEAIIVACPMCQSNLDMRRKEIDAYLKKQTKIPVLFITQAIGMAMGLPDKALGLQRLFVPLNFNIDATEQVKN